MSDSGPPEPDLSDLLWRLAFRYQRAVLAAYERYGEATRGVRLLEVLDRGPAPPTALTQRLGLVRVSFTVAGAAMMTKVKAARAAQLEALLESVGGVEQERLEETLALLVVRLEA